MSYPIVAIIGRPNVGKSSLFNKFLSRRVAIVDDTPGVTRDRNYGLCEWGGKKFYLIDTGGIIPDSKNDLEKMMLAQSEAAIEQADLTLFTVDCQTGVDSSEQKIARRLLEKNKQVILLANKADDDTLAQERFQFLKLGLGEPTPVSAMSGEGLYEVLDRIAEIFPATEESPDEGDEIRIAVIGKPNVGKSLFINRLIGEERVIVSPIPGTTRDAVDTPFEYEGKKYILIDTAGLRRKARVTEDLEFYTNLRTLRAIEGCHVALVLVDGSDGLNVQDLRVIEDAARARRAVVLAVNKWDLVEKDMHTVDILTAEIKKIAPTLGYIPVIFISSLTGQRVVKVLSIVDAAFDNWNRTVPTAELNRLLEEAVGKHPPAAVQGKYIKFNYVTQAGTRPPSFQFFCNFPKLIQKNYIRFLENQLREKYDFSGVPIRIRFKKK